MKINQSIPAQPSFKPINMDAFEKRAQNMREAAAKDEFVPASENKEKINSFLGIDRQKAEALKNPLFDNLAQTHENKRQWTVMLYANGNCDLQDDIEKSVKDLESVGSDDKITFLAQLAQSNKDGKAQRMHLKKPSWLGLKNNTETENLGKTNMAHPQSLKDFVSWGMKKFPAKHYMLILSGHGYGFIGSMPDEQHNDDILLTPELKSALDTATKEAGQKIDVVGFDSCLMANAETAAAIKDSANFMVGSEEVLFSGNWQHNEFAAKMKEEANGDGLTVGETLEAMIRSQNNYMLLSASIIDCRNMPGFIDRLKDFSDKLLNTDTSQYEIRRCFRNAQHYCQPNILAMAGNGGGSTSPMNQMRDVGSLALEIITNPEVKDSDLKKSALETAKFIKDKAVLFEMHRKGVNLHESSGISIYAPIHGSEKFTDFYSRLTLGKETGWDKVIEKYGSF
ncbi:MAG: clostripain-related cysteine peptidase [Vulcanimicrobiota bacterium]